MPSSISELLQEDQINLDLRDQTQSGALRELVDLFGNNPAVKDLNALHEALLSREKANSTVVGNGVAFPHARTDCVEKIVLAVGRSAAGVKFESSPDPVHLIFMIGTPKALISEYPGLHRRARPFREEQGSLRPPHAGKHARGIHRGAQAAGMRKTNLEIRKSGKRYLTGRHQ